MTTTQILYTIAIASTRGADDAIAHAIESGVLPPSAHTGSDVWADALADVTDGIL